MIVVRKIIYEFHFYFQYSIYIAGFQTTILSLDFRLTFVEENGGDDGNSSVSELKVRVETLEGTAVDHDTKISTTEVDVNGTIFLLFIYFFIETLKTLSALIACNILNRPDSEAITFCV